MTVFLFPGIAAQQNDNEIRLRVSIMAADTGEVIWTDSLEDRFDDFFRLQDRLTLKVLKRLTARLDPQPSAAAPDRDVPASPTNRWPGGTRKLSRRLGTRQASNRDRPAKALLPSQRAEDS